MFETEFTSSTNISRYFNDVFDANYLVEMLSTLSDDWRHPKKSVLVQTKLSNLANKVFSMLWNVRAGLNLTKNLR